MMLIDINDQQSRSVEKTCPYHYDGHRSRYLTLEPHKNLHCSTSYLATAGDVRNGHWALKRKTDVPPIVDLDSWLMAPEQETEAVPTFSDFAQRMPVAHI